MKILLLWIFLPLVLSYQYYDTSDDYDNIKYDYSDDRTAPSFGPFSEEYDSTDYGDFLNSYYKDNEDSDEQIAARTYEGLLEDYGISEYGDFSDRESYDISDYDNSEDEAYSAHYDSSRYSDTSDDYDVDRLARYYEGLLEDYDTPDYTDLSDIDDILDYDSSEDQSEAYGSPSYSDPSDDYDYDVDRLARYYEGHLEDYGTPDYTDLSDIDDILDYDSSEDQSEAYGSPSYSDPSDDYDDYEVDRLARYYEGRSEDYGDSSDSYDNPDYDYSKYNNAKTYRDNYFKDYETPDYSRSVDHYHSSEYDYSDDRTGVRSADYGTPNYKDYIDYGDIQDYEYREHISAKKYANRFADYAGPDQSDITDYSEEDTTTFGHPFKDYITPNFDSTEYKRRYDVQDYEHAGDRNDRYSNWRSDLYAEEEDDKSYGAIETPEDEWPYINKGRSYSEERRRKVKNKGSGRKVSKKKVKFYAKLSESEKVYNDFPTNTPVPYPNIFNNVGGGFNGTVFTAPVSGVYAFRASLPIATRNSAFAVYVNREGRPKQKYGVVTARSRSKRILITPYLEKGDTVHVELLRGSIEKDTQGTGGRRHTFIFTGKKRI